jgi:membrane associated rhomboid family serine protease
MLIINGGIFLLQLLPGRWFELNLGLTPARFYADFPNLLYQVFTYMFLHSTAFPFFHLLFNMLVLWMFGTEIELTWRSRVFGRFYLLAGIAGSLLTLIVMPSSPGPVIGASGAVYGVLIAYWLMFPQRQIFLFPLPIPMKVKWAIPGMMLVGFLFSGGGVAHMAHLGGALFGFIYLKLDWRWLTLGKTIKNLRYKRKEAKLNRNRQKAEDVMKKVDTILDKINAVGIENITEDERRFLEEASTELSQQNDRPRKN